MFQPGQSGNPAGRPKGTKNRITQELREAFALVLENNLPQLQELLARVAADDPKSALELILKLSNRFLPELSRQELTGLDGEDLFKNLKFDFGNQDDSRPADTQGSAESS